VVALNFGKVVLERISGSMEVVAFVIGVVCGVALGMIGSFIAGVHE
jgi:hypothetical protein